MAGRRAFQDAGQRYQGHGVSVGEAVLARLDRRGAGDSECLGQELRVLFFVLRDLLYISTSLGAAPLQVEHWRLPRVSLAAQSGASGQHVHFRLL